MIEECVNERSRIIARRRMHDEPGRLVQHDNVGVLINNVQGNGLGQNIMARPFRQLEGDLFPGLYLVSGFLGFPIDEGKALPDQRLNAAAGDVRLIVGDEDVEALSNVPLGAGMGSGRHGNQISQSAKFKVQIAKCGEVSFCILLFAFFILQLPHCVVSTS